MKALLFALILVGMLPLSSMGQITEKIKVASIFAKTGPAAAGNKSAIDGVRFAVQILNRQGGVLNRQIEVVEFDNHSTALHSRDAAQKAVQAGVVAVFGANWSSHSIAMAPILQAAHIPMLSPFSTNPDLTLMGDYIFRLCFIDSFQGEIMANFAIQDMQAKTAAILVNASQRYSEGLADFFSKGFVQRGGKILLQSNYLHDTENFSTLLETIATLGPDVVFVPGNIVDSGRIIKQARQMGIGKPILGGDGWGTSMYGHAGSALHNAYFSEHWHRDNPNEKSRQFVKAFQQTFHQEADSGTALAYDAVFLFADALGRANTFAPQEIQRALAATRRFEGVTGRIGFDANRNPVKSAVISRIENKTITYVKTVEP